MAIEQNQHFRDWENKLPQQNGYKNGLVQNGQVKNGLVPNGQLKNGLVQNGQVKNGLVQNGHVKNGFMQNRRLKNYYTTLFGYTCWKEFLHSDFFKALMSVVYFELCCMVTQLAITFVQYRIPDRTVHPPLSDIFLDNVSLVQWGNTLCEVIVILHIAGVCTIVFFHKHRWVVARRMFSIIGTIYLLRGVLISTTRLPVPSTEKECEIRTGGSILQYFETWSKIASAGGFQSFGLKTCGDYMFSGHSAGITFVSSVVREYSPRNWKYLHMCSWISVFTGMFFILASHGHYSIDVIVGFLISHMLFHLYHVILGNRNSVTRDRHRIHFLFPCLTYFEDSSRVINNEYEWPLLFRLGRKSLQQHHEKFIV